MRAGLFALAVCIAVSGSPGCKKKKAFYDRSTPAKTLESLSKAFAAGKIPADLGLFFVSRRDLAGWKARCKDNRCKKATFKIKRELSRDEYSARLLIDVTVFGDQKRERLMVATDVPITFVYEDSAWFIEELGEYKRVPIKTRKLGEPDKPAPKADGGP